jgi:uncharacterized membrane protein YphA (DoxX/SURF4 family)
MYQFSIVQICQILIGLFMGVCMLQSGTDKIFDWKGNYSWLNDHFSKSFLSPYVKIMLLIILFLETVGGIICLIGSINGIFNNDTSLILLGFLLVGINLLFLFLGQRLSKDYEGAAVIVNYFILTIIGIGSFHFI